MWLDGGSSTQMCQYERMQILGIRHPLPVTASDTESAAGLCVSCDISSSVSVWRWVLVLWNYHCHNFHLLHGENNIGQGSSWQCWERWYLLKTYLQTDCKWRQCNTVRIVCLLSKPFGWLINTLAVYVSLIIHTLVHGWRVIIFGKMRTE